MEVRSIGNRTLCTIVGILHLLVFSSLAAAQEPLDSISTWMRSGVSVSTTFYSDPSYSGSFAFFPDRWGTCRLFRTSDQLLVKAFNGNSPVAQCVGAVSPDGAWVAVSFPGNSGSNDTYVYHLPDLALVATLDGTSTALLFSPDGAVLAASTSNRTRVWSVGDWSQPRFEAPPTGEISFSPDARTVLVYPRVYSVLDGTDVTPLNAQGGPCRIPGDGTGGPVFARQLLPGMAAWAADFDVYVQTLSCNPRYTIATLPRARITQLAVASNGVMAGVQNNRVVLWETSSFSELNNWTTFPMRLAFSPDGTSLLSWEHDQSTRVESRSEVWSIPDGGLLSVLTTDEAVLNSSLAFAFSPDSQLVAAGLSCCAGNVRVFQTGSGSRAQDFILDWDFSRGGNARATSIAFSMDPNHQYVATTHNQGDLVLWNYSDGSIANRLTVGPRAVAFSSNGLLGHIAGLETNPILYLRSVPDLSVIHTFSGVNSFVFSPDGTSVYTTGAGGVTVYSTTEPWGVIQRYTEFSFAREVVLSPNGAVMAALGQEMPSSWRFKVWRDGILALTSDPLPGNVLHIVLAPDTRTLMTTHSNGDTIELWDAATGLVIHSFTNGVAPSVTNQPMVAYSPDGTYLGWSAGWSSILGVLPNPCGSASYCPGSP
jgi:WD40 repeat protein